MNEPKKPLGWFQTVVGGATQAIRENYARRLGRAYDRGFEDGKHHEAGKENPYTDDNGEPRRDEDGNVILPD